MFLAFKEGGMMRGPRMAYRLEDDYPWSILGYLSRRIKDTFGKTAFKCPREFSSSIQRLVSEPQQRCHQVSLSLFFLFSFWVVRGELPTTRFWESWVGWISILLKVKGPQYLWPPFAGLSALWRPSRGTLWTR